MPDPLRSSMPSGGSPGRRGLHRRSFLAGVALLAVEPIRASAEVFGGANPKVSDLVREFTAATSAGWQLSSGATVGSGQLTMTGAYQSMASVGLRDFTNDTLFAELLSVSNGGSCELGVVGPDSAGGYLIGVTRTGKLRMEARRLGSYYDSGAVEIPYQPSIHRWLFLTHTRNLVSFKSAATRTGERATLRTAGSTDVDTSALTVRLQNNVGTSGWDNVNTGAAAPVANADVSIDFGAAHSGSAITALSFGSCISTFAGDGQNVNIIKGGAEGAAWKSKLAALGPLVWRIPLAWNGGRPGSSASGARSYGDAGAYVRAIKDIGGTPMIALGGTTNDNDIKPADAASLVRYFNDNGGQNGGPVDYWIIGNEPDNTGQDGPYIAAFNGIAKAMRAATSRRLYLGGPTLVDFANYKQATFNRFLETCGAQVDRMDFHKYGAGLGLDGNLTGTMRYEEAAEWLKGAIAARPSTANRVKVQCGELNYHPAYNPGSYGGAAFYTSRNTVHTALAIGHLLNGGAAAYQYSDNNGPLGLITPGNSNNGAPAGQRRPTPAYFGLQMWTGGKLFRRPTGSMASVTHTVPDLEVFASTGTKNIIVINTSLTTSRTIVLGTGSVSSGSYTVWQTKAGLATTGTDGGQWAEPKVVKTGSISGGRISLTVPALTVTCILV